MKKSLKLSKVLGYYKSQDVVVELQDGRFAMVNIQYEKMPILVASDTLTFLRGKEFKEDITEEVIGKVKEVLSQRSIKIKVLSTY